MHNYSSNLQGKTLTLVDRRERKKKLSNYPLNLCRPRIAAYIDGLTRESSRQAMLASRGRPRVTTEALRTNALCPDDTRKEQGTSSPTT